MSSSSFSNLSVSFPFPPERTIGSKLPSIGSPSLLRLTGGRRGKSVMIAAEGRDNLDHLQRQTKQQSPQLPQQQPKRRVAPVAPIGLWDRFPTARTVQQMMETMERVMDDPFAYSTTWPSPSLKEEGGYRGGRTPWDIKEGENDYKMRFDMPGMTRNDVKVWVEDKMLVVKAEKVSKKKKESEGEAELMNQEGEEWSAKSYGRYNSRIALPENIEFEKIKAEVRDGVLYIDIPKASSSNKVLDINVQ
ncbi:small heat shock protein, chloroplastic-like [Macadamia integrifolia]|uniref:small heat shock protein, chloroplastic-like n=1 Tax=Macadamia integrifolia TaxID=60698 RepID=UPI001C4FA6E1|nr:small heat shock protein, chloroplastic-like [Macadamia integrifolia]